ncbi:MAG: hypothetical protein ACRCST_16125 [Turicibacter sp.]
MSLHDNTICYIENHVNRFYAKAIEHGAVVSDVIYKGANLYTLMLGNCELTYMGTVNGTAQPVGISGEIFE